MNPASFLELLFWLIVGHALADYPLQGPFLSEAKNRNTALGASIWPWTLASHAMIHGGAVAFATGSPVLGMYEAGAHFLIDLLKCDKRISFHADQILHLACKVLWAYMAINQLV